jgi:cyclase
MTRALIGLLAALLLAGEAAAQRDFSAVEIRSEKVAEGLFMLTGSGGNIGLSVCADGAFIVDDQYAPLSEKILAAIRGHTDAPVEFVLNTHFHGDHTGGNEAFAGFGARIVAHDNVRRRLKDGLTRASGQVTPPSPAGALPILTFSRDVTFHWNGGEIHVFHPGAAHTDGDAIVHFRALNAMHLGDLFFNKTYPFIDLEAGGDLNGYIAAKEKALALADGMTRIIPGHGPLASKADLQRSVDMLKQVRARVQALIDRGLDEDGVVAAEPLADLNAEWSWAFINGETMTRTAFRSLKKAK